MSYSASPLSQGEVFEEILRISAWDHAISAETFRGRWITWAVWWWDFVRFSGPEDSVGDFRVFASWYWRRCKDANGSPKERFLELQSCFILPKGKVAVWNLDPESNHSLMYIGVPFQNHSKFRLFPEFWWFNWGQRYMLYGFVSKQAKPNDSGQSS